MAKKQIVEEAWPHGRRTAIREADDVSDAVVMQLVRQIALGAKTSGLLDQDDPFEATLDALRNIIHHPSALKIELKKMGRSSSRAARAVRDLRKEV